MFPFNENPISSLRTSSDIERFGRQALLRALNIGRVVAFVGSGTSLKFGQPSWSKFADRGVELFFALETAIIAHDAWRYSSNLEDESPLVRDFRQKLSPLVEEIKELRSCQDLQPSHLIELIEDYFAEVSPLLDQHGITYDDLGKKTPSTRRRKAIEKKLTSLQIQPKGEAHKTWVDRHFGPVINNSELKELPTNVLEFRRLFAEQFGIVDDKKHALKISLEFKYLLGKVGIDYSASAQELDKEKKDTDKVDAARILRRRLGVRRFLTLNYDLELEMMLFEEGRSTPTEEYSSFNKFLLQEDKDDKKSSTLEAGRAVTLQSPSGRVIRSSTSRVETLADLFSFGAFPTNYDASVHHLHGRIDDPENMIITPKDYQRIYYGASDQKKSFDEARHAVFTGSDLLVLGLGTSEHDVLKPLRDFLELEADRRDAYGNVYYVTGVELSGKANNLEAAMTDAQRDAKAKTQSLYKDYGMHTLFFDLSFDTERSRSWTSESATCFAARAEIANYLRCLERQTSEQEIQVWTTEEDFAHVFGAIYRYDAESESESNEKIELIPTGEIKVARDLIEKWNDICKAGRGSNSAKGKIKAVLKALDAHLRDRGLVNFAEHLEKARKEWWSDWSQLPGYRVAVLGPHKYKLDPDQHPEEQASDPRFVVDEKKIDEPLVWRQTNLEAHFRTESLELGNKEKTPQFSGLIRATAEARRNAIQRAMVDKLLPAKFPASIARISIPPGGGKGRLLTYFTTKQQMQASSELSVWPFQTLFAADPDKPATPYNGYKACFMSHLTFAIEFSGTMIAFARLLQNLLHELRREAKRYKTTYNDDGWDDMLAHQFHRRTDADPCVKVLREMFALLQRNCPPGGWKTRMVAIFSYLDRLVDDNGDAFSPTHRAFLRLISGWSNEDQHMYLPVDFVFINCHADQPIRYLSIEEPISRDIDERRDEKWKSANWRLRHDRGIALQHWTELKRVRPKVIFLEALEHSAKMRHSDKKSVDAQLEGLKTALGITAGDDDDSDFLPLPSNLKKFMYRRVANGHFLAGLATAIWEKSQEESQNTDFATTWQRSITTLDIAYAREKSKGLIDELLSIYRRLDREFEMPIEGQSDDAEQSKSRIGSSKQSRAKERLRTMMIDHLALLQVPTTPRTLISCPDIRSVASTVIKEGDEADLDILSNELESLIRRGLASRYVRFTDAIRGQSENRSYVYVLNTKVASVLRARANLEVYSQYRLMVFQPNAFPSQPERALKPDANHFERVSAVVRALVKSTQQELVETYWKMRKDPNWSMPQEDFALWMEECNDRLRAAYALVRGTFSISVIARLAENSQNIKSVAPFDEYRTWTRKLLNTAALLRKIRERDMKKRLDVPVEQRPTDALPYNHPFLRDEVSWLYNERALVSFVQGRLFDALPLFEQAQVMLGSSSERSSPQSEGATHRRIQMNFALAQVERGNIVTAQQVLTRIVAETDERWKSDTPSVINCMAKGFLALCYHLTNEFARAQSEYEAVLEKIGQFNHPRAESIFRRHYADLLRAMATSRKDPAPEFKDAISNLRGSEELALGIRATDLHHYAIMARARLNRDMKERGRALENLRRVEDYARSMGIQKMLCEVLKVRGEVLLAEGETTQAGFVTAQSIAISKRNGMRLRKISASIIQAQILRERGQIKDAQRLLSETITESQALGYATKTSQAINMLRMQ